MLFVAMANAQVSYSFTASTGTYTAITSGTSPTLITPTLDYAPADEGFANDLPIGFTFNYNGVAYTRFNVNVNGFITFGAGFNEDPDEDYFFNKLDGGPFSQQSVRPVVAPLWDDLHLVAETDLKYTVTGTAPNRVLTIEWGRARWIFDATSAGISFQARLYETTNIIEFIYKRETGGLVAPSASIGLSAARTGIGNSLSLLNSSAAPTTSTTTSYDSIKVKPATNQLYRFTPLACIAPSITQLTNVKSSSVTFSWNAIDGVTNYEYAFSTSPAAPASGTSTTASSVNISGLTPGVNNYLYVRSVCGGGNFSAWSRRALVQCTSNIEPANGAVTPDSTVMSWNPVPDATGYTIMIGLDGVDFLNIGTVNDTVTSIFLRNLDYSTTYHFYIRAVIGSDTASEQCSSNATSFTVKDPPVIPCTMNVLPANGAQNVNPANTLISWRSLPNATEYVVMFSFDNGATYELLGTTPDTAVNIGGLGIVDYDATYYYYIRPIVGRDSATTGCQTNATSFKTRVKPPAPSNDNCDNAIQLTGTPVNATTLGATESLPAEDCNNAQTGFANDDVWFKFTALSSGGATISLTNAAPELDAVILAYTGTCGNLVLMDCKDATFDGENETLPLTNLVSGQTYYFRVYGFYAPVDGGAFTIQVNGPALPVLLANFKGENKGTTNVLNWTTLSEQNSKGFELQRSVDGNNFSPLGFVSSKAATGNSVTTLNYGFVDTRPFAGSNYYRIRQLDRDGKFTYSSVVLLRSLNAKSLTISSIYPNPVSTVLNMVVTTPTSQKLNVVVTDLAGKIVMQQSMYAVNGDNKIQLNIGKLPSGSYLLKAICDNGCETAVNKFVKH